MTDEKKQIYLPNSDKYIKGSLATIEMSIRKSGSSYSLGYISPQMASALRKQVEGTRVKVAIFAVED
mgnify:CR=1 FL=1